jgi:hypothetical protein
MKTLLSILFLTLVFNAKAQQGVERMVFMDSARNFELAIRKFSRLPMKFISPLNRRDTLYIGVMADSVSAETTNLAIYGYFPLNIRINNMIIIIEYTDGSEDVFKLVEFDQYNYGTFEIQNDLYNIYSKVPNRIKFRNFAIYTVEPKHKNFFIDFLKKI